MDKQPDKKDLVGQQKRWTDSELLRVSRVFELLARIEQRLKKGKVNDDQN